MNISGRVHNGVVIPNGNQILPEGAAVIISIPTPPAPATNKQRLQLPLVPSARSGSVSLTNERIGALLEEEDLQDSSTASR